MRGGFGGLGGSFGGVLGGFGSFVGFSVEFRVFGGGLWEVCRFWSFAALGGLGLRGFGASGVLSFFARRP